MISDIIETIHNGDGRQKRAWSETLFNNIQTYYDKESEDSVISNEMSQLLAKGKMEETMNNVTVALLNVAGYEDHAVKLAKMANMSVYSGPALSSLPKDMRAKVVSIIKNSITLPGSNLGVSVRDMRNKDDARGAETEDVIRFGEFEDIYVFDHGKGHCDYAYFKEGDSCIEVSFWGSSNCGTKNHVFGLDIKEKPPIYQAGDVRKNGVKLQMIPGEGFSEELQGDPTFYLRFEYQCGASGPYLKLPVRKAA